MSMNPPKCDELDYIHFLIAAQKVYSNSGSRRVSPGRRHQWPSA